MASEVSEGRTLLCIVLVREVNSLKKDKLLFITSRRAFTKKYHIEKAFEIKLLILASPLTYLQLLRKEDKEERCPCEYTKVTEQQKGSNTFP